MSPLASQFKWRGGKKKVDISKSALGITLEENTFPLLPSAAVHLPVSSVASGEKAKNSVSDTFTACEI